MPRQRLLATIARAVSQEAGRQVDAEEVRRVLKIAEGDTKSSATNAEAMAALEAATKPKKRAPRKRARGSTRKASAGSGSRTSLPALRGTVPDPEVKAKLRAVIDRDQELAKTFGFDEPDLTASGAIAFKYLDPMNDLLEDIDLSYVDPETKRTRIKMKNYIRVSQERLFAIRRSRETPGEKPWRYTWRSPELYKMVERLLSDFWVVAPSCRACEQPIFGGFKLDVRDLLLGKKLLDDLRPPGYHDACFGILHVFRDLELALKGRDQDDPETVAFRSNAYVDAIRDAKVWLEKDGVEVTNDELMEAFHVLYQKRKGGH